jgi:hypothetical protein
MPFWQAENALRSLRPDQLCELSAFSYTFRCAENTLLLLRLGLRALLML